MSPYARAILHAALGEKEQALSSLQKAFEIRDEALITLNVDPRVDSLRSDPRFMDLLRRMNFSP